MLQHGNFYRVFLQMSTVGSDKGQRLLNNICMHILLF